MNYFSHNDITTYGMTFVACHISIYSVTQDILYEQSTQMISLIHDCGGYVFMLMSDNLRTNHSAFNNFHSNYKTKSIWSINHHIPNTEYSELFLLYDPANLIKNIRNNLVEFIIEDKAKIIYL